MARLTDEQRNEWMQSPDTHDQSHPWRYWVLRPGETIHFPSGTIHAVFRTREARTLELGGHVLQWTGVSRWKDIIQRQTTCQDSTNEDVVNVGKWLSTVECLLGKREERMRASR